MGDRVVMTHVQAGRGLPRRKAGGGAWEVLIGGRWIKEDKAMTDALQAEVARSKPPASPSGPVTKRTVNPRGLQAYELCAPPPIGKGMYWADAAPLMDSSIWNIQQLIANHMKREGIEGPVPGRMPDEVRIARQKAARSTTLAAATTAAPVATGSGADQDAGESLPAPAASPTPAPEAAPSADGAGDAVDAYPTWAVAVRDAFGTTSAGEGEADGTPSDPSPVLTTSGPEAAGRTPPAADGPDAGEAAMPVASPEPARRLPVTEVARSVLSNEVERLTARAELLRSERDRAQAELAAIDVVLANLEPTLDAYRDLLAVEAVAA